MEISTGIIKETISRLRQDPAAQLRFTEDESQDYLNLREEVFNVKTGEIEQASNLEFGYRLNFSYQKPERRKFSTFDRFLNSIFPDHFEEKRKLLLQILGYVISDCIGAKAAFFFIGKSNSGKSTLLELLRKILPERSIASIPLYRLENRFNLAHLSEVRININSEISEKSLKSADIFKMLTSNEVVTAEHKGKKPFEFRLKCKVLSAGNCMPNLEHMEGADALLNRMIILWFPVSIRKENQDRRLLDKLWHERDSIFSAAVDELVALRQNGFHFIEPEDTRNLKEEISRQGAAFEEFLRERCILEEDAKEHVARLFEEFEDFCKKNLYTLKLTKNKFSQNLTQLPHIQKGKFRKSGGPPLAGVFGLRLKTDMEYESQDSQLYSGQKNMNKKTWNIGTLEQEKKNEK